MNIRPISSKVNGLSLKTLSPQTSKKKSKKPEQEVEAKINFNSEVYVNNNNNKLFRVRYRLNLTIPFKAELDLEYDFDFESDDAVGSEFPRTLVVRSEVPSFAYPYMKAYLETILNLSGVGVGPLPCIDFLKNPMPDNNETDNLG